MVRCLIAFYVASVSYKASSPTSNVELGQVIYVVIAMFTFFIRLDFEV